MGLLDGEIAVITGAGSGGSGFSGAIIPVDGGWSARRL